VFRSLQTGLTAKARVSVVATTTAVSALATTLAVGLGATPGAGVPARAQAAAAAKPASMELMNDMALAAAVNACEMVVESKVPMEKAVVSSAKAITYVVTNRYGGQVANAGRLEPEQIANGTIIQVVGRVRQGCYNRLGANDKKFIDDVLSEYTKAVESKK
jgi:hypothetical protein